MSIWLRSPVGLDLIEICDEKRAKVWRRHGWLDSKSPSELMADVVAAADAAVEKFQAFTDSVLLMEKEMKPFAEQITEILSGGDTPVAEQVESGASEEDIGNSPQAN